MTTGSGRDPEALFRHGAEETDALLSFCGIRPSPRRAILEIGCGPGRMTRRLSDLFGRVIALGASPEMLARARRNLADRHNVEWVLGSGSDLGMLGDGSVEPVFSYISLQHVPRREDVLSYLEESGRVLRQGGRGGLQVRRPGVGGGRGRRRRPALPGAGGSLHRGAGVARDAGPRGGTHCGGGAARGTGPPPPAWVPPPVGGDRPGPPRHPPAGVNPLHAAG